MSVQAPAPMCFIAMPFGKRTPPGAKEPVIDFDRINQLIVEGAKKAGLEPIRADFELSGGFIEKPMLERLLVAEYVVADLTLCNPNVLYEVGVRHGASERTTILICAEPFVPSLAFDVRQLRTIPYSLDENECSKLSDKLCERLQAARDGKLPSDNPLMQVTSWKPSGSIEHSKTDVFLNRIEFAGAIGQRIKQALAASDKKEAIERLAAIEDEVVHLPPDVSEVHTALLGVFIAYREKEAYDRMEALFGKFPNELKRTPVAREQYALALNRLAEAAAGSGEYGVAEERRQRALQSLDEIPPAAVTSETYGIRGRIHKGWRDALVKAGGPANAFRAEGQLQEAIDTYEQGFRKDIRDFFPGVNAVTLRLLRGSAQDSEALRTLVPAVRYSVDVAPEPKNNQERYWQTATRLELASAAKDWDAARSRFVELLGIPSENWMRRTTSDTLERHQCAFASDANAAGQLAKMIGVLRAA